MRVNTLAWMLFLSGKSLAFYPSFRYLQAPNPRNLGASGGAESLSILARIVGKDFFAGCPLRFLALYVY